MGITHLHDSATTPYAGMIRIRFIGSFARANLSASAGSPLLG
jgi:hypothetical protein